MKVIIALVLTILLTSSAYAAEGNETIQNSEFSFTEVEKLIDENPEAKVKLWCLEACNEDYGRCVKYQGWRCSSRKIKCKETCW